MVVEVKAIALFLPREELADPMGGRATTRSGQCLPQSAHHVAGSGDIRIDTVRGDRFAAESPGWRAVARQGDVKAL